MKTQEEIEQLAEQDFNDRQECGHYELADLKSRDYYYDGFTNGYTQCQEDMADKKYTEDDIRKAIDETIKACNNSQKESYGDLEINTDEIINSLNKQD